MKELLSCESDLEVIQKLHLSFIPGHYLHGNFNDVRHCRERGRIKNNINKNNRGVERKRDREEERWKETREPSTHNIQYI